MKRQDHKEIVGIYRVFNSEKHSKNFEYLIFNFEVFYCLDHHTSPYRFIGGFVDEDEAAGDTVF